MGALTVLAENNFGDTRSGGLAGPMGLLIIVLLGIVTVFLIRNMTARIRRLPAEFPDRDAERRTGGPEPADRADRADSGPDQLDKSTPV
ncbi:hypothetical protein [Dactylosporangium sp. NPDC048998]|uniref:hypothetical protein n=1 Tax=Dactylosporangium sp. NPDC048998 TaxID=3363976 RepID=UPI00371C1D3B